MRLFRSTNIDFLGIKHICIGASIALAAAAGVSLAVKGGPSFGIDFTGGSQIIYGFQKTPDESEIRRILEGVGVKIEAVQRYDKPEKRQVIVRVPQEKEGRDVTKIATTALTKALAPAGSQGFDLNLNGAAVIEQLLLADDPEKHASRPNADPALEYKRVAKTLIDARSEMGLFPSVEAAATVPGVSPAVAGWLKAKTIAGPFTLISADTVGPQVGKDLRAKGMWAVILSWAAMLSYIAFRFRSVSFGTAAVVALIHDTWITLGFCSLLNVEITLTVVAAFLTLIGYSVNDTVVVYDRIRENREKSRRTPLADLVNRSVNQTLSRTILTSGLTFLVVVALFLLGGEVLHGFAFVMLVGIIVGTYSSIFIASPLVIMWENWRARKTNGGQPPAASTASAPVTKKRASR